MNPPGNPNAPTEVTPPPAFSVDDVFFTLFKHKWIILVSACLGVVAAGLAFKLTPLVYSSKAKLVIRYVIEDRSDTQSGHQDVRVSEASEGVLNTEQEIISSLDVAKVVADKIGADRILAMKGGGTNALAAAITVKGGVTVIVGRRSEIMLVFFEHPDRTIVQPVLSEVISAYLDQHLKLHSPDDTTDAGEEVQLREKLLVAEKQLEDKMRDIHVVDIDAMKKVYNLQLEKLNTDLLTAQTEVAERESVIQQMAPGALSNVKTNAAVSNEPAVPADKLDDYSLILGRLSDLGKKEREFRMQGFTDAHPSIASLRNQRDELLKNKALLETSYPSLLTSTTSIVSTSGAGGLDVQAEVAKMLVLKARVRALGAAISNITSNAFDLAAVEPKIAELRRDRDELKRRLDYLSERRDSQRKGALSSELTNIKVAENPTPPAINNQRRMKATGYAFGAFLGLGLAISFLLDFVIDRTIRRSMDVKRRLKLPVLLSIEDTSWRRRSAITNGELPGSRAVGHHIEPWEDAHHLRMVSEGLRERIVTYFEIHEVTHTPKLVALTSCNEGSGVSTLAGSLAAALSKTGEGSVLLVDMQNGQGDVKPFYKGKPGGNEPTSFDPSEHFADEEESAEESTNLVMTPKSAPGRAMPGNGLHNSLTNLVPSNAAKNYDYIVFDMPVVTPTSVTPRLASHMDLVLLVLESGKTGLQVASQANSLLSEARVNTVAVLNKCRRYVPERLSQEL